MDASIASLIDSVEHGDRSSAETLFATLYSELHRLARSQLARNASGLTLGTTTLLHEVYVGLAGRDEVRFPDRGRFMAYAARAMRGLIIDYARQRRAMKRGGQFEIASLDSEPVDQPVEDGDLVRLNDALDELSTVDPSLVQVVDLKFFCGFSFVEIAAMRNVSERTVLRQWEKARLFLFNALGRAF